MTREKEINIASEKYINENTVNGYVAISNHKDSFIVGAEWADNNPKSLWISVEDDLPCNHKELLNPDGKGETSYVVAIIHGYVIMNRMYKLNGKWYWENDEPTHWFPIPKLPKTISK